MALSSTHDKLAFTTEAQRHREKRFGSNFGQFFFEQLLVVEVCVIAVQGE
jgi:hypothetical protein